MAIESVCMLVQETVDQMDIDSAHSMVARLAEKQDELKAALKETRQVEDSDGGWAALKVDSWEHSRENLVADKLADEWVEKKVFEQAALMVERKACEPVVDLAA